MTSYRICPVCQVSFIVWLNESGQPNASKVVPVDGGSVHEASCCRVLTSAALSLTCPVFQEDIEFHGIVKYMSKEKGYGFIECKETHLKQAFCMQPEVEHVHDSKHQLSIHTGV